MSSAAAMPRLALYGHSWVAGVAASRPQRRLSDLAAARLGMTPVNLGVGGSSTIETAALVSRHGIVRAEAYLILAGLNDARLHGRGGSARRTTPVARLPRVPPARQGVAAGGRRV